METSRSKTIRNHSGTTCANYFAKQFLAIVAAARVVRPLRYWFDRVVTMLPDNASPFGSQCRMSWHVRWTSVSRDHTGVRSSSCSSWTGLKQIGRPAGTSFPMNVWMATSRKFGRYVPINPIMQYVLRIKYVNVKMWLALWGAKGKVIQRTLTAFLTRDNYSAVCLSLKTVIDFNESCNIDFTYFLMLV